MRIACVVVLALSARYVCSLTESFRLYLKQFFDDNEKKIK